MDLIDLGGTTVVFGSTGFTTVGQCASGSLKKTEVAKPVKNDVGGTRGKIIYDIHYEASAEVVVATGTTEPEVGDAITLGGVAMHITSCETKWAEEDFKKHAFNAETWQTMIDAAAP